MSLHSEPEGVSGQVKGAARLLLRTEAMFALLLSILFFSRLPLHPGHRWWLFAALFFVPDLSMLGYLAGARAGATLYNLVHTTALPLGAVGLALLTHHFELLSFLCIWTAHIGFDRMLGYGLKYPAGFGLTHLGILGKKAVATVDVPA